MIRKNDPSFVVENFDFVYRLKNNNCYNVKWKAKVVLFHSCGNKSNNIECLVVIPESVVISYISDSAINAITLSLSGFNHANKDEQLDLKCNCHGFTFANGKFIIDNFWVDKILEDEFVEVTEDEMIASGNFDVICFKNTVSGEWVHSCKYVYDLYIHKVGLAKFSVHTKIEEILAFDFYANMRVCYFSRNEKTCTGICLQAIGEVVFNN